MGTPRRQRAEGGSGGETDMAPTRHDLHGARHLPGHIYYSEEIYELEIEKIWMKEWLCVGRVEQFPKAGDYTAMRIAGEPVIVCKDKKGKLNAFSNVCRHRGVEVAPVVRVMRQNSAALTTAGSTISTANSWARLSTRRSKQHSTSKTAASMR